MLGSPKDKSDMLDKTGTVYHYTCQECPSHYISETERPLRKRVSEHRDSSPVGAHSKITKHSFDPEHFNILDTDPRWHQRGIKEAIYIAARKLDLNKDLGRKPTPESLQETDRVM